MARPNRRESAERSTLFLEYVAGGMRLRTAARLAQLDPGRALDVVDDPMFWPRVFALRKQIENRMPAEPTRIAA